MTQYPIDLVLVRHGQSEGNLAQELSRRGDDSCWTEEFSSRHTSRYRLTDVGREQACAAGQYIRENIYPCFDRYYCSEFARAMETAALLGFSNAKWFLEFYLREQDRGYMGGKSSQIRDSEYKELMAERKKDSFYFTFPGGESIANACQRVDKVLTLLKEHCAGFRVVVVCHGNIMMGFRIRIERMSQARYRDIEENKNPKTKLQNGGIIHYTRRDPLTGEVYPDFRFVRCICPWDLSLSTNDWEEIKRPTFTSEDLMLEVHKVPQLVQSTPECLAAWRSKAKSVISNSKRKRSPAEDEEPGESTTTEPVLDETNSKRDTVTRRPSFVNSESV